MNAVGGNGRAGRAATPTRTITGTALLLAMGVVLPIVFHAIPLGGRVFSPMHIPVLIAGLVLGPIPGLVVGVGSPVASTLITGRPTVLYLIPMIPELATYGIVAGLLRGSLTRFFEGRRPVAPWKGRMAGIASPTGAGVVLALVGAMLVGRAVWFGVVVWLAPLLGISARTVAAALAALGAGWIGMVIHVALIPAIVRAIERPRAT